MDILLSISVGLMVLIVVLLWVWIALQYYEPAAAKPERKRPRYERFWGAALFFGALAFYVLFVNFWRD